ncbi:MAG TPA: hypothetical protein VFM50_02820 [Nocardioidaceae bacterium]|nr:hypothetical protein [Nocardioidaceae bacterium]
MTIETRLRAALRNATLRPEDAATVELAHTYARYLDAMHRPCEECRCPGGHDLAKVGPALLAALAALGLTPAARAALAKTVTVPSSAPTPSPLDELVARRAARNGT